MTLEEISLVQESWKKVVPIKEAAAEIFYGKLFELDPNLRALFKGDMKEQGRKLMAMINTAIGGLTRIEELVPVVQNLGRRHVAYGVKSADYATVAAALLWTLQEGLGTAFTSPVKAAWVKAYTLLAETMKAAAAAEAA